MAHAENSIRARILQQLLPNQNLLAVSKLQSAEKIKNLYLSGQRDFAENYIQEALEKINELKDLQIHWHLIGKVQKNKVKYLNRNFEYIHSVDSFELAKKISDQAINLNFLQKVFLQVNISKEESKSGFEENELLQKWDSLKELKGLSIVGLMTMPPLDNEPQNNQIYFKKIKKLADQLKLKELSMGTSHDYQIALKEGATWIRLGTMLFGERTQSQTQKG